MPVVRRVNEARWQDGYFNGVMSGDLRTEDTGPGPATIQLLLKLRGDVLNGSASASAPPGRRGAFNLTHWVEVRKQ